MSRTTRKRRTAAQLAYDPMALRQAPAIVEARMDAELDQHALQAARHADAARAEIAERIHVGIVGKGQA